jgi:hypothetical protein
MPENPWVTIIAISCDNHALRPQWKEIEDQLRMIVYRCGWDTHHVTKALVRISLELEKIEASTPDMRLPPHKRFK